MAKLIYNKTRSHGNPSTPASGAGIDVIKIKVPNGQKFSHFTISQASGHSGTGTFTVTSSPKANATGNIEIKVMWTNGPFSKCRYRLKVLSSVASTSTSSVPSLKPIVVFGDNDWYNLATGYIKQKIPFILRIQGPDASKLINIVKPINTNLIMRGVVINEAISVAITIAVCITIVSVAGLAVLGAVLLYSINQGCNTNAVYDTSGNLTTGNFGQKFDFVFVKCKGN